MQHAIKTNWYYDLLYLKCISAFINDPLSLDQAQWEVSVCSISLYFQELIWSVVIKHALETVLGKVAPNGKIIKR